MTAYAAPVLAALFVWWFSTGVVLLLDGLPRRVRYRSLIGATAVAACAFAALVNSAGETTVAAAYTGFMAAIVIWGWQELAFLLGVVTGPRRTACPPDVGFFRRFLLASQTLLYHELALAATLGLIALLTWGAANQVGLWTFAVLFGMRLSSKLNIFLGVLNVTEEFLPGHMRFLTTYFARRSMNALFPLSVTAATLLGAYIFHAAFAPGAGAFAVAAYMLTGTLILLGTLEHWLLVLPMPGAALWRWALRDKTTDDGMSHSRPVMAVANKTKTGPVPAVHK